MKPLQFRVKYKVQMPEKMVEGIETEASWYYLDQRGKFYSNAPMRPIIPCDMDMYEELTPLIKIGEKYMSVDEIEDLIQTAGKMTKSVFEDNKQCLDDGDRPVVYVDEIETIGFASDMLLSVFDKK